MRTIVLVTCFGPDAPVDPLVMRTRVDDLLSEIGTIQTDLSRVKVFHRPGHDPSWLCAKLGLDGSEEFNGVIKNADDLPGSEASTVFILEPKNGSLGTALHLNREICILESREQVKSTHAVTITPENGAPEHLPVGRDVTLGIGIAVKVAA